MPVAFTPKQTEDAVRDILAGRADRNSQLNDYINHAQQRIARKHDWIELSKTEEFSPTYSGTVATDRFFALSNLTNSNPKGIYSVIVIDGASSRKLIRRTPRQWDSIFPHHEAVTSIGRPSDYVLWQDKLEFYRIPETSRVFDMRLQAWPINQTSGATTGSSDLKEKDDAIIYLSAGMAFNSLGEYEKGRMFTGFGMQLVQEAIEMEERVVDRSLHPLHTEGPVRGRGDYWANPWVP